MSWRRVGTIYVVLALLAAVVIVGGREGGSTGTPERQAVGPSMLATDAAAVQAVTFRKGDRSVRAVLQDRRWRTIEPAGAEVSSDLIAATIATLTEGQAAEKLAQQPEHDLAAYGLDAPSATVDVVIGDAATKPVTVEIGARNPTQTAVYARRRDQPAIFLVGMNLSYYIDLIFDAARS